MRKRSHPMHASHGIIDTLHFYVNQILKLHEWETAIHNEIRASLLSVFVIENNLRIHACKCKTVSHFSLSFGFIWSLAAVVHMLKIPLFLLVQLFIQFCHESALNLLTFYVFIRKMYINNILILVISNQSPVTVFINLQNIIALHADTFGSVYTNWYSHTYNHRTYMETVWFVHMLHTGIPPHTHVYRHMLNVRLWIPHFYCFCSDLFSLCIAILSYFLYIYIYRLISLF